VVSVNHFAPCARAESRGYATFIMSLWPEAEESGVEEVRDGSAQLRHGSNDPISCSWLSFVKQPVLRAVGVPIQGACQGAVFQQLGSSVRFVTAFHNIPSNRPLRTRVVAACPRVVMAGLYP
jgi:hypothetical protein